MQNMGMPKLPFWIKAMAVLSALASVAVVGLICWAVVRLVNHIAG